MMDRKKVRKIKTNLSLLTAFSLGVFVTFQPTHAFAASPVPKVMNFVTEAIGGGAYTIATGVAAVLSGHLPTEVKVVPTTGPNEVLPMFVSGEADMTAQNSWNNWEGWRCGPTFKKALRGKRAPIRILTAGSPNINSVIVAVDSGIRTGKDLKGKKFVGVIAGSPAITNQAHAALAHFGLTPDDVRMISVPSVGAGLKAIIEGRADALGSAIIGMGAIVELDAKRGARFLSVDPSWEAVERYRAIFPAVPVKVEPRKGLAGVRESIHMMQYGYYLVGRKDFNDETAYQIVKTLWDYNEQLKGMSARLKNWSRERFIDKDAIIPYHPGAIKFYKEKDLWSSGMDSLQEKLVGLEK